MTADVTRIFPGPLIPGCTHAEIERLTQQYQAELAQIGDPPKQPPPAPSTPVVPDAFDPKRLTSLTAKCAMAGVQLYATRDGSGKPLLLAIKWAEHRSFSALEEAAEWLERVAGVPTGRAEAE